MRKKTDIRGGDWNNLLCPTQQKHFIKLLGERDKFLKEVDGKKKKSGVKSLPS